MCWKITFTRNLKQSGSIHKGSFMKKKFVKGINLERERERERRERRERESPETL